jgi:hypothetical protein
MPIIQIKFSKKCIVLIKKTLISRKPEVLESCTMSYVIFCKIWQTLTPISCFESVAQCNISSILVLKLLNCCHFCLKVSR